MRIFLRFFFSPSTGAAALAVFFAAFAPSADLAGALDAVEAGALPAVEAGLGAMDVLGWVAGECGGGGSSKEGDNQQTRAILRKGLNMLAQVCCCLNSTRLRVIVDCGK